MRGINQVFVLGTLGREPEVRRTQGGNVIANLALATNEAWTSKTGEKQEHTEWHRCVLFGRIAEVAEKYLTKGDRVHVSGKLRTNKWTAKDGTDRYTTEIVVSDMQMLGGSGGSGQRPPPARKAAQEAGPPMDFDDEIPF
jgi:single-strand DNA-binding protein